jgi:hypothetical protein
VGGNHFIYGDELPDKYFGVPAVGGDKQEHDIKRK